MDSQKQKFICSECNDKLAFNDNISFNDKLTFDKHKWLYHPKDEYQKYWSKLKLSGKLESMTLGYQDNPYY